jgi:hypothetical protein
MVGLTDSRPEEQRRVILIYESQDIQVSYKLEHVIHGRLDTTGGVPGTLAVFGFRLLPKSRNRRIKSAIMTISFADENGKAAYDPEVVDLAPQGDLRLFPASVDVTTTTQSIFGGEPRVVKSTKEYSMALIGAARYDNRDNGGVNGVLWFMRENELMKYGVPSVLRAAVLLKRIAGSEDRRFHAHVRVKVELVGHSILSGVMPRSLERKSDDPIIFNPRLPQAKPVPSYISHVSRDLGCVDLTRLAFVYESSVISSPPGEVELAPMVMEGKSWSEGSTKDQILLNFSKGQFSQLSYKFKRFETLSLWNLYNYQHKLVELDKKINGEGSGMDAQDVNELARLLREYRKWHGIFWLQKPCC